MNLGVNEAPSPPYAICYIAMAIATHVYAVNS